MFFSFSTDKIAKNTFHILVIFRGIIKFLVIFMLNEMETSKLKIFTLQIFQHHQIWMKNMKSSRNGEHCVH